MVRIAIVALCVLLTAACGAKAPDAGAKAAPATQQLLQQFDAATSPPATAKPAATRMANYTCDKCIKGNISEGKKIYHYPGCPNYDATKVNEKAGERWFSSEEEAKAAGWHRADNCR